MNIATLCQEAQSDAARTVKKDSLTGDSLKPSVLLWTSVVPVVEAVILYTEVHLLHSVETATSLSGRGGYSFRGCEGLQVKTETCERTAGLHLHLLPWNHSSLAARRQQGGGELPTKVKGREGGKDVWINTARRRARAQLSWRQASGDDRTMATVPKRLHP